MLDIVFQSIGYVRGGRREATKDGWAATAAALN